MSKKPTQLITPKEGRPTIILIDSYQENSTEELEARLVSSLIAFNSEVSEIRDEFNIEVTNYNYDTNKWDFFTPHYTVKAKYRSRLKGLLKTFHLHTGWLLPMECLLRTNTLPILLSPPVEIFERPADNPFESIMNNQRIEQEPAVVITIHSQISITQLNRRLKEARVKLERGLAALPKKRKADITLQTYRIGEEVLLYKQRHPSDTAESVLDYLKMNELPGADIDTDYDLRKVYNRYLKALMRYTQDKV